MRPRAARRQHVASAWRTRSTGRIPWAANVDAQIFFVARLPRVLAAALVGAALASSGVVFQALLRNPLATPFTLGVSAGAALGAMLVLTVGGAVAALAWAAVPAASFLGALGAVAVVYLLAAARHRGFSTSVLLLAGVTLNSFLSALILLVQYFADMTPDDADAAVAAGRPGRRQLPAARGGAADAGRVVRRLRVRWRRR